MSGADENPQSSEQAPGCRLPNSSAYRAPARPSHPSIPRNRDSARLRPHQPNIRVVAVPLDGADGLIQRSEIKLAKESAYVAAVTRGESAHKWVRDLLQSDGCVIR